MGAGASVNDVASHVKGHGSAYNYIAAAIEENGLTVRQYWLMMAQKVFSMI